ncbi:GNAT family N-acetyltransferase [Pseudonocardia acaciae]|uniref:GNAT family N-acetyltransferase n=1 Tax=Pseudonocardia acaciae TaxID=551276 RepID=UPI0006887AD1|nr:GNAT family N-acetyltransferase [Pseudonocardia acaciae]
MTGRSDRTEIEFRAVDYGDAHAGLLAAAADAARAELPGHPDLEAPPGDELEAQNRGTFVVAYLNGQPSASGGYRMFPHDPTGSTAEIVRMYVRPGSRGSGLGRALLRELEERAWDDDYERVVLHLGDAQPAAKALYEVFGYRLIPGLSPDPWPGGRQTYGKDLKGAD